MEQALDLSSWPDARSSQTWEKRHARLKMEKKRAACVGKGRAAAGKPNAPRNDAKNSRHEGKAALTLLHVPPTFAPPRAETYIMVFSA